MIVYNSQQKLKSGSQKVDKNNLKGDVVKENQGNKNQIQMKSHTRESNNRSRNQVQIKSGKEIWMKQEKVILQRVQRNVSLLNTVVMKTKTSMMISSKTLTLKRRKKLEMNRQRKSMMTSTTT